MVPAHPHPPVDDAQERSEQMGATAHQRIAAGREQVAGIYGNLFRIRDTCGAEAEPGHDDTLILAVTAALDRMAHD